MSGKVQVAWQASLVLCLFPAVAAAQQPVVDIGALLGQAEAACRQQDKVRLHQIGQEVNALAQQPILRENAQYLHQLMQLFAAGHCDVDRAGGIKVADKKPSRLVQVSAGYLDNVNQGSRHERIALINPLSGVPVEGVLDEKNRPLSSSFVGVQGIYRVPNGHGTGLTQLGALQQFYLDEPDFNVTGFFVSRLDAFSQGQETKVYLNVMRNDSNNMEGRAGGVYYQPLGNNAGQRKLGLLVGGEYLGYSKHKLHNAAALSIAVEHKQALSSNAQLVLRARMEYDKALNGRFGGDSREAELSALWKGALQAGWQPAVAAHYARKLDAEAYDPRLYGNSKRTQTRPRLELGASKSFGKENKIHISYQYARTRDSGMPLFDQGDSNVIGVAWESSF